MTEEERREVYEWERQQEIEEINRDIIEEEENRIYDYDGNIVGYKNNEIPWFE